MFKILFLLLFPSFVMAQAQPSYDPSRVRYAVYEVVKLEAQRQGIPANDPRVAATAQSIGSRFADAANNPQYQQTATRWAWILFRLLNGASPYLSIALELCRSAGCIPSPQTTILSVPKNNAVITRYQYDLNSPIPVPGLVYFAGRMVPKTDFSCGGTDSFILNAEYYYPGDGTPCRVRMAIPSALDAFTSYLNNNMDYFGIDPEDLVPFYAANPRPSMAQLPSDKSIVCYRYSNISPSNASFQMLAQNPYFPCIDTPPTFDPYSLAEGQPQTFEPYAASSATSPRTRFATDFDITSLPTYPPAQPRGVIEFSPWADAVPEPAKSPLLDPRVIRRLIELTWPQSALSPGYLGLPWPSDGIPDSLLEPLPDLDGWPEVGDLIEPMPEPNWYPSPRNNTKPLKRYVFRWTCGFADFPRCLVQLVSATLKPDVDLIPLSGDPFDPLLVDQVTPKNFFSKYLSARLTGASCTSHHVSGSVLGKSRSIDWDFCPFATVARDVLALMAYIITAGAIFGTLSAGGFKK